MKKKTSKPAESTIEKQLEARSKELTDTLGEIVKTIEDYFRISPLQFVHGDNASPAEYLLINEPERPGKSQFRKFFSWIEDWMGVLFPVTLELQEKIKAGEAGDSEYMELSYESQHFGFVIGYLVGCKSMGASHSEMMDKAEAFTITDVNWRLWRAESEQEKGAA